MILVAVSSDPVPNANAVSFMGETILNLKCLSMHVVLLAHMSEGQNGPWSWSVMGHSRQES